MNTPDIAIPILPSRSLTRTIAFYRSLGFTGEVHPASDSYAILTRGSAEIHFFSHPQLNPDESFAGCYIRVSDADEVFNAMTAAGLPKHGRPRMDIIEDKPWGMREFAIVDEDGNLLRIGQVLPKSS